MHKKRKTEIIPCNIREPECESDQYETKTTTARAEKRQSEVFVYKLENMTFNFGKRKHNFSSSSTNWKAKEHSTPNGKLKNQEAAKQGMSALCGSPIGKERN